jgi:hypothetical protein
MEEEKAAEAGSSAAEGGEEDIWALIAQAQLSVSVAKEADARLNDSLAMAGI